MSDTNPPSGDAERSETGEQEVGGPGTCTYTFNPARETEARLQTTWECPHPAHDESDRCVFHMSAEQRRAHGVSDEDLVEQIEADLRSAEQRATEYVGADLPYLSFTYQDINGGSNHVLNFQYATIDGLDFTHATFHQGLNLREATVDEIKMDNIECHGIIQASDLRVNDEFSATESTFYAGVEFSGADFRGSVCVDETDFYDDTHFANTVFHSTAQFRNITTQGTSHVLDDHITFKDAAFRAEADFQQSIFEYAMFEGATFRETADFNHVTFNGDANLHATTFEQTANFNEAVFDDDVRFDEAQFKTGATFRGAQFLGGSRVTEDDICFEDAEFGGDLDFKLAQFRYANFCDVAVNGTLNLDRAVLTARLDAHRLHVAERVIATDLDARANVRFDNITFEGDFRAQSAEFEGDAHFENATFSGTVDCDETRFREDVTFQGATFQDVAEFRGAVFEGEANHVEENTNFNDTEFQEDADFTSAEFTSATFWDVVVHAQCSFKEAVFTESARFRLEVGGTADTYADFTGASIAAGTIREASGSIMPYAHG